MKCLVKILAALGAIVAIGAVLYCLRDKLKALCPCCCGKNDFVPAKDVDMVDDEPLVVPVTEPVAEAPAEEASAAEETPAEAEAPTEETATAEDFVD